MIKKRLINLLPQAKKYVVLTVLFQWLALISQIGAVYSIASFLTRLYQGNFDSSRLVLTALFLCFIIGMRFFFEKQSAKFSFKASSDVKRKLRKLIYEKLLRLGASYNEQVSTSEVVQITTEGVEQLEIYFGKYLAQLFYSLIAPFTLFILFSFINVKTGLVLLLCVPLIPISIVAVQKFAKKLLKKYWGSYTGLGDSFLENLQGLTTLKIYQADESRAKKMDEEAEHFRKITMKVLTMQLNSISVMDIVAYGGSALGIIMALLQFRAGHMDLFGMVFILLLASEFFIPMRILGSFFHIAMNGMAASDKIFALLDLPEEEEGEALITGESVELELNNVQFSYDGKRSILNGVSMKIESGNFLSLVGESGCGKSTIASLIAGNLMDYSGDILLNKTSIREIREAELFKNITTVKHNSYIFKGTVRDHLLMGKADATEEEMIEVLKKVNLWKFLFKGQGLSTVLLEKGSNLSGGQCQRLNVARALLHDSKIYIFDEATSNIDAESEEMIMKVIKELAKTKTVLLISHRLANVVDSDVIYMMKNGKIIESGSHSKLITLRGSYEKLYNSQKVLEGYGKEAS